MFSSLHDSAVLFAVLLIIPAAGFSLALAFYKINNKPFIEVVEAAFRYTTGSKLFIWKKRSAPLLRKSKRPPCKRNLLCRNSPTAS